MKYGGDQGLVGQKPPVATKLVLISDDYLQDTLFTGKCPK